MAVNGNNRHDSYSKQSLYVGENRITVDFDRQYSSVASSNILIVIGTTTRIHQSRKPNKNLSNKSHMASTSEKSFQ